MKNKKGNVAVIALIIVIVAITTGVITWLAATKSQAPAQPFAVTQSAPVTKTQPAPTPVPAVADWKSYKNEKYGFELTLPETWKGYRVVEQKLTNINYVDMYDFEIPNASGGFDPAVSIRVIGKKDVAKCEKSMECNYGAKILEDETYIYAEVGGTSSKGGGGYYVYGETEKGLSEIDNVVKSFKLVK